MPLSEERRTQLDGIVRQMMTNGESENTIQFVVNDFKSKYEQESNMLPDALGAGAVDSLKRFGNSLIDTINPMNAVRAIPAMIPGTQANADATYARLKQQETNPAASALANSPLGQFGGVNAGQRVAEGDVAGGLGELTGDVLLGASGPLGMKAAPKAPGVVAKGARVTADAIERRGTQAAALMAKYPTTTTVTGGVIGGLVGGPYGAIQGLLGGGVTAKLKDIAEFAQKNTTAMKNMAASEANKAAAASSAARHQLVKVQPGMMQRVQEAVAKAQNEFNPKDFKPKFRDGKQVGITRINTPRLSAEQVSKLQAIRESLNPTMREIFDQQLAEVLKLNRKN